MKDKFSLASSLTETDIKNYADSKYVKSYYSSVKVNSNDLEKAEMSSNNDMPEKRKDDRINSRSKRVKPKAFELTKTKKKRS